VHLSLVLLAPHHIVVGCGCVGGGGAVVVGIGVIMISIYQAIEKPRSVILN